MIIADAVVMITVNTVSTTTKKHEETPDFMEIDTRTTSIEGLVDFNGSPLIPTGKMDLDDDCLIPRDPFKDKVPDKQEYEGYMGNVRSSLLSHICPELIFSLFL